MNGYEAVRRIAQDERPSWLPVIRDIYDFVTWQADDESRGRHFCAKWVRGRTGRRLPALAPLERWGVLEKVRWGIVNGIDLDASGRNYYRMLNVAAVGRALDEVGA